MEDQGDGGVKQTKNETLKVNKFPQNLLLLRIEVLEITKLNLFLNEFSQRAY